MGAPGLSCYTPLVASCSTGRLVGSAFCVPDPLNVSVTTSRSLCLCRSLSFSVMHPISLSVPLTLILPLCSMTHALKGAVLLESPANETFAHGIFDISYMFYWKTPGKHKTAYKLSLKLQYLFPPQTQPYLNIKENRASIFACFIERQKPRHLAY